MAMARGSTMSSKQLARTVVDGRRITLVPNAANAPEITGYLCGLDDYHLFVVLPDGEKLLVSKGGIFTIRFAREATYQDEALRDELEQVVGPFRAYVQRESLAPTTKVPKERLTAV